MPDKEQKGCCELCGREQIILTRHHLIPRTRHNNRRIKRRFSREQLHNNIAWVCRPCHNQVHAVLSEKLLAEEYHTLDTLKTHPEIERFVEWIANKPAGYKPRNFTMRGRK